MGWEKYKISEFLENFRWQITNMYKGTPKVKFWWHIFKTLIGAIFYSHPLVFFVLIIMLRSETGFNFNDFVIYGLALSNFAQTLSNQMVNFRQIDELNKYINKIEQIGVTFNSYEVEDYVEDEMVIDRLRKSRPNALMSNAKLGHIFKMNRTTGITLSALKGFVISRSLGLLSPFKTQNKSYVFIQDAPDSQSATSKYKLYHELGHLTDGSFQRRHSVYHYKLTTVIFIIFFILVAPPTYYWLLLFLLPYFYLINAYTTERNNEYIDELCCDIFAIDMFEDRAELTTLKRTVPKVVGERYKKLENIDILPKDLKGQTTIEVLKNFIDRKWLNPGSSMSLAYISRIPEEEWILASSLLVPIIAFLFPPLSLNQAPVLFTLLVVILALGLFTLNGIQIKRLERKTNALKSMNYTT